MMRTDMNIAIVAMVKPSINTHLNQTEINLTAASKSFCYIPVNQSEDEVYKVS